MELYHTDQMNQTIRLEEIPRRIVSLVPSQTELLYDLGLEEEIVGITKFCIHPDIWYRSKERVGGTKQLDIEKIRSLKPDLIIGNKEENTLEDIERLKKIAPVWMSDIYTLDDALQMIHKIGILTGKDENANQLIKEIRQNFSQIQKLKKENSVLYFIWKNPDFVAGRNTFIDAMLRACGLNNLCTGARYPEWSALHNKENPDFIFLSSEPYPFKEEHIPEFESKFPNSKLIYVDGEMFSWYGSRMKIAPKYFQKLLDQLPH